MTQPEYLHLGVEPTAESVRELLRYISCTDVHKQTQALFSKRAVLCPSDRLAFNLNNISSLMTRQPVRDVLRDGLLDDEARALVDLDLVMCPDDIRCTARALLNVKERWIYAKCMSGVFNKARLSSAYINTGLEDQLT